MNILHVISSMAVEDGGPPAVCAGLAGAQARAGHHVSIATVDTSPRRVDPGPAVEVFHGAASGASRYRRSSALETHLRQITPRQDIVHIHGVWQFSTWAAARVCRQAGIPYVLAPHGMLGRWAIGTRSYMIKRLYWQWRGAAIARGAAAIHCLNAAEVSHAATWIATCPKMIVPNGVAAAELNLPPSGRFRAQHPELKDRPLVLFLARMHPIKGLERLLAHWPVVLARVPDACLVLAGTGAADYTAKLDAAIAEQKLGGHVVRVGQLAGHQRWEALVDADVFVLPSFHEAFSMSITEALGAGCPAVITAACNYDEVRSNQAGVVIEGADQSAFAAAVADLLLDPAQRRRMGAAGRALVLDNYTWEKVTTNLDAAYAWIINGRALPADGAPVWRAADERATPPGALPITATKA